VVAQASETLEANATLKRNFGKLSAALSVYPVARTRPFFDAMEKSQPGTGGLYSVSVDPWKCSGCLECIDVCGPGALVDREQDEPLLEQLQTRFEFLSRTPNTPARFTEGATREGGETKRLMLDRANYYATTGGHGACRGCGEVTAIRLVTSTNHAIHDKRRKDHTRELEGLIDQLTAKRAEVAGDAARAARIDATLKTLEKRLYLYESGPTGNGPSGMVIANATGCSSVYASTFPFNPYTDPWVNSLFQDTPAVAKGIFEGLTAQASEDFGALRIARLELADAYEPAKHDGFFRYFGWGQFTPEERGLLPTVLSMGGDGATYDIGFGALSRLLSTKTPIKVVVLNTGAYSNTGGQTSTASLTGQDSDLSRFGIANHGKQESRKELGLIASFHPNVFVVQTATALQGHFLKNVMEFLNHTSSPAVLDVYTPCQAEHGIGDAVANRQARLAVESRMNPVFVHDPRKGAKLNNWFALDGNPEADQDWASRSIEYIDDNGATQLMKAKLTPADFAYTEVRFRKQFKPLKKDADGLPVDEYVALDAAARAGKTPFIHVTDGDNKLVRMAVGETVIALVEERRKYWRTLQYLGGFDVRALDEAHNAELAALQHQYEESVKSRETSLDAIARGMSELAASSNAPAANGLAGLMAGLAPAPAAAAPSNGAKSANGSAEPIHIDEGDLDKCTNCKSCYQDVPEVFELTKIVVGGASKEVAHVIPGVFSKIKVTPELSAKLSRAAANCDAEIIR
jgi:pyruvate-ferredoxin/flavodoxin oxidoreductase